MGTTVTTHTTGGDIVVELRGDVGVSAADELRRTLVEVLLHRRPSRLVIDLSEVEQLDPTNVGGLVAACQTAGDLGIACTIRGASPEVTRLLVNAGMVNQLVPGPRQG